MKSEATGLKWGLLHAGRAEVRIPCTPRAHRRRHFAVTASQTAAAILFHEDKVDVCTRPVGHTEEVKEHFFFNVYVYPYHIICLLLEAAFFVFSERHSFLTTQFATVLCLHPPSPSCWAVCGRMWFLLFTSGVCRDCFDSWPLCHHIYVPFLFKSVGIFMSVFCYLWSSAWMVSTLRPQCVCVCPVSGTLSTFISGVFYCLRRLLKMGSGAFSLDFF